MKASELKRRLAQALAHLPDEVEVYVDYPNMEIPQREVREIKDIVVDEPMFHNNQKHRTQIIRIIAH